MKKLTFLLLISMGTLAVRAQKETRKWSFGIGLEGGIPTGPLTDLYSVATGGTVRLSYHAGPGFATLTSGLIGYIPKTLGSLDARAGMQIPVRAGYKYILQHHLFVMGEVGYAEFVTYYGVNGDVAHKTEGEMIFAPSVGYQVKKLEAGLRLDAFSNHGGAVVGIRVGLNF
jgi:hypothetical protein